MALVGDKFIYREAGLEDNTANRLLSSGWLYLGPSSADSGISFLLSGGLNITRGLRFRPFASYQVVEDSQALAPKT